MTTLAAQDLTARRRFFAEEIQVTANLRSSGLVEALATVPRERFLPPGPWTIRGEADFQSPLRQTLDDDPRHVYHNVAIGIDPARMLFNGAPGLLAMAIDALCLRLGSRVLHVGPGTGYYTALMGHCVGPTGRVAAIEVDGDLAADAARHLASMPWISVGQGDGTGPLDGHYDGILINAGVTHPEGAWLDALAPGGRMILPLTAAMPAAMPGPTPVKTPAMSAIGKGLLLLLTRTDDSALFDVRVLTFLAIYSAVGLRDDGLNGDLGRALAKHPFPPIRTFRRDPHEPGAACWLHGPRTGCFSLG
jgi:protein-L-isoaspartate(D-aspartate) O-methyltransferase